MKMLNVAIVGCGAISQTHIDAVKKYPNAQVYAVCDIDELKAGKVAWEQECRYYVDFEEMLEDADIDVVHVCTPHYLHFPMVCKTLEKNKHVLTEKPLGLNERECKAMRSAAEESKMKAAVCMQNRLNPTSVALKQIVEKETYGKIKGMRALVSWHRDAAYYEGSPWKGKWKYEGGGLLMNQMIHTLDLMQWLGGPIKQIKGHVSNQLLQGVIEEEDTAEATIWFEDGVVGSFYATNTYTRDSSVMLELHLEQGLIRLQDQELILIQDNQKLLITTDSAATKGKDYWGASHEKVIHQFYDAILQDSEAYMKIGEGVQAVVMCKEIYKSSGIEA